ncbi:MAG: UbiD family decarboxylase, partial [Planctomycetaceae bacterium]|nr:UbiD family decarboxylase [Planctomycetaceae bacterium]
KEIPSLLKSFYYSRFKHVSTLRKPPVLQNRITLEQLPQLVSWQEDGGAYITLPQVYTESGSSPFTSNLGMYRVQISGNDYIPNEECGLHYQIQRGIALHHAKAKQQGRPLPVKIFVGGAPCMTLAAVMPLPENVSEILFAGILGQHRIPIVNNTGHFLINEFFGIYTEADFCITGTIDTEEKTEGPFGDHLGYYSLAHKFPVMKVTGVYHRKDAIYPFTVVGRPPQEDTEFGKFIHNITGDVITKKMPGIEQIHAVDEAGVHPLLLAVGRETYPNELHTLAHSLLGSGQLALAKYLFIIDKPKSAYDIPAFFQYVSERVDWTKDLHFITQTSIDTLDYSSYKEAGALAPAIGSKVFITATGEPRRKLSTEINTSLKAKIVLPGVLCCEDDYSAVSRQPSAVLSGFPLIVLVDNCIEAASSVRNFLWTTFTKSDPASDIRGIDEFTENKHWGCRGSLIIDARRKPHHAPELVEEPDIAKRAEEIVENILRR